MKIRVQGMHCNYSEPSHSQKILSIHLEVVSDKLKLFHQSKRFHKIIYTTRFSFNLSNDAYFAAIAACEFFATRRTIAEYKYPFSLTILQHHHLHKITRSPQRNSFLSLVYRATKPFGAFIFHT